MSQQPQQPQPSQRTRPNLYSQIDVTTAAYNANPGRQDLEQTRLLREILSAQDRQNELLEAVEAKQADAATDVSQAELEARTSAVFLEISQAQIDVLAAQRRVKLYRDKLMPQAEATFKASAAAYQNNRGDFSNLIDSQNLLLDIQTAYYKASAAIDTGIAELERATGAPLASSAANNSGTERISK